MRIKFTEELWKEGGMYVSYAPELDIAACGETVEQAKANLVEVISINFDEMKKMGTLDAFFADAGFNVREDNDQLIQLDKELIAFQPREIAVWMDAIRPLPYRKVAEIFEAAGCVYSHTKGDHLIYHYPGARRPVIIPKYREVPVFVIKNNMKVIGLSREQYLNLAKVS
jgi:predicted RNA binding protein YcfA (HicA-like mRNA interferase family)/predicted RNase H-like HicB family nuclease